MSVIIPLKGSSPATSERSIRFPIGAGLPLNLFGAGREEKAVRAVAAAAALEGREGPAEALKLAKQAVDDPAAVAANTIDPLLAPVLAKVSAAIGQAGGPQATAEQVVAARAVGVDAALVAVAQKAMQEDAKGDAVREAREWVATIEPVLLERAARAGLRQRNLELVPKPTGTVATSRLDDMEIRLKALEDAQQATSTAAKAK